MQLRSNALLRRVRAGVPSLGCGLDDLSGASAVGAIAAAGSSYVFIDLEHSPLTIETTANTIALAHGAGITPLVRVAGAERPLLAPLLDSGCQSVVLPQAQSRGQVETFISNALYPPLGDRGVARRGSPSDNFTADVSQRDLMTWQNDNMLIGIYVESTHAIANIRALLLPRIDFVHVGMQDLSAGLAAGESSPALLQVMRDEVYAACAEKNVAISETVTRAEDIPGALARGATLVRYGGILSVFRAGFSTANALIPHEPR